MGNELMDAQPSAPIEDLLTLDEAVQFLGTSKPTLYRVLALGELRGLKVGRQWRFRRSDLTAYMERSPVAAAAPPNEVLNAELEFFGTGDEGVRLEITSVTLETASHEDRIALLADRIVAQAVAMRASDIHIEPVRSETETYLWLRYRIDGVLHEIRKVPPSLIEAITLRFKQMGDMNLGERRVAQDGRCQIHDDDLDLEIRMSILPTLQGESLVMRILNRGNVLLGLDRIGMEAQSLALVRASIAQPTGLIVVTGPTAGGKTTTVYSCLSELANPQRKTITVEDPVELSLPFATQTQVNRRTGMTFAACLHSSMRQDLDVLYSSEIRDIESIQAVIEAALTGHLVLTSLHADDSAAAINRLIEIGIEPFLLTGTLISVIAQRLVRKICDQCREPGSVMPPHVAPRLRRLAAAGGFSVDPGTIFQRGHGCDRCRGTGYRGRTGLFEVMHITPSVANAISLRAPVRDLVDLAVVGGMRTLLAEGMRLATEGVTTWEEVLRVVGASLS